CASETVVDVFW
nr:immunoglobulin heavy chain junction region [Macaca mulatta]MOW19776.1 immunoglobulin heavy chain junction region [Macaca mulatta]MOW19830.1 immunoglobulin heavy chain junction region [Macaca mulatta]MOW20397.1 immunoglobulin heavy chain junction region [Macaca mulatta]MOW20520.1 immunoglobulin heavy chain junction region [Macaca mulatta]